MESGSLFHNSVVDGIKDVMEDLRRVYGGLIGNGGCNLLSLQLVVVLGYLHRLDPCFFLVYSRCIGSDIFALISDHANQGHAVTLCAQCACRD